jgi:hypothetical protein
MLLIEWIIAKPFRQPNHGFGFLASGGQWEQAENRLCHFL